MYALTTVILAVGEIDGELRSAVLEDTHACTSIENYVALATCMHNFGRYNLGLLKSNGYLFFFLLRVSVFADNLTASLSVLCAISAPVSIDQLCRSLCGR